MFISKSERMEISQRLYVLEEMVKALHAKERIRQERNIAAQKKYAEKQKIQKPKAKRSTYNWTPEARAIQGERVRLMWAKKKAAKA